MTKHLTLLIFIFSAFWSCASTSDDALRQQENFIKIILLGKVTHLILRSESPN